jgi:hypothetical protein
LHHSAIGTDGWWIGFGDLEKPVQIVLCTDNDVKASGKILMLQPKISIIYLYSPIHVYSEYQNIPCLTVERMDGTFPRIFVTVLIIYSLM